MTAVHPAVAPRPARFVAWTETPFVTLGPGARFAFLMYLLAYRVVFPLIVALGNPGAGDLFWLRFVSEFFYTCLIAYPFIFFRKEYGWLHPLVLPILWEVGKAVAKNPLGLIFPFEFPLIDYTVQT